MLRTYRTSPFSALALLVAGSTLLAAALPNPASRNAMIHALGSPDPNPMLGDEARTFDRLVGTWDADFSFHRDDGTVFHKKGELHFGWVMDGTAIQDLWIGYPAEAERNAALAPPSGFSIHV